LSGPQGLPALAENRRAAKAPSIATDLSQRSEPVRLVEALPLLAVLAVATFVRVIGLDSIEPNVLPDEADNLQVVYHVLAGTGPGPLGLSWDGQSIITHYFQALSLHVFGMSIFGLRMSAVIPSLLSIVVFYLLVRDRLSRVGSLLATLLLSTGLWYLCFSRNAWTNIYVSLYMLLAAYFISLALRKTRYWWLYYGFAGLAATLGLYSYFSGRLVILALLVYLPFAVATHRDQTRRVLLGYGIVVCVAVLLFIPEVPSIRDHWDVYTRRTAATFIFSSGQAASMALGDKALVLLDQAQRNLRGFLLMDGGVIDGFRYSVPGEPLLDRISAVLFLAGAVLSLRYWRESALWWCFGLVNIVGTQILSNGTPDPARAIGAAPFYFPFIGLLFDRLFLRPTWYRNAFQLAIVALLPVIIYINFSGYVNWMRDPATAAVRQPAVENWEFATWQELQYADAKADRWGFNVSEWHEMRGSLGIPRPDAAPQGAPR
jgi:4-amino-4-deoxy-L-arabinose transferase-like glycosyltransferase